MSSLGWSSCPQDKEGSGLSGCASNLVAFYPATAEQRLIVTIYVNTLFCENRSLWGEKNRLRTTKGMGNEHKSIKDVYEKWGSKW